MAKKHARGDGLVFPVKGSKVLHYQVYVHGQCYRGSTGETDQTKAQGFRRRKLAELESGKTSVRIEKVMVSELIADKLQDKQNHKALVDDTRRWTLRLEPFFGSFKAVQVSTDSLRRYIARRQKDDPGVANGTINRELSLLRSAFNLGRKSTPANVHTVPYFPMLAEAAARDGFIEDDEHVKFVIETGKVGLWLRTAYELGVSYAWRRDELFGLKVSQFSATAKTLTLRPVQTKNATPRVVKLSPLCLELVTACAQGKGPDDYLITRDGKPLLSGSSFRKLWISLCQRAGKPGLLFHDLRRTGARNMRRDGNSDLAIMQAGGWKTRSVFDRYAIANERDMQDQAVRLEARQQRLAQMAADAQQQEEQTTEGMVQ